MKKALSLAVAALSFAPSLALACPYASASGDCGACGGSSLAGYVASILLGLGAGFASVAWERKGT